MLSLAWAVLPGPGRRQLVRQTTGRRRRRTRLRNDVATSPPAPEPTALRASVPIAFRWRAGSYRARNPADGAFPKARVIGRWEALLPVTRTRSPDSIRSQCGYPCMAGLQPGSAHTAAASRRSPSAAATPHGASELAKRLECASLPALSKRDTPPGDLRPRSCLPQTTGSLGGRRAFRCKPDPIRAHSATLAAHRKTRGAGPPWKVSLHRRPWNASFQC